MRITVIYRGKALFFCAVALIMMFFLVFVMSSWASADGGDGSLSLNPAIITNSDISAGTSSDFPIKSQLFLPSMDKYVAAQKATEANIAGAAQRVNFAKSGSNGLFQADYGKNVSQLFTNYHPQVIVSSSSQAKKGTAPLYVAVGVCGIGLTVVAVAVGRRLGRRKAARHGG